MAPRVRANILGAFTDAVLRDSKRETYSEKALTAYGDFSDGVMDDIERASRTADLDINTVDAMVVANALIRGEDTLGFRHGVPLREARVAHGYHGIGENEPRRS